MLKSLAKYYYRQRGHYPVKIGKRRFRGDPWHPGFWRIVNRGGFEPEFFQLLDKYLDTEMGFCDIGSWIGPTVMYASGLCREVYAFEPDPVAYPHLLYNIRINGLENIQTFPVALSGRNGILKMASHGGKQGDSMSSMINIDGLGQAFDVKSITWQTWLEQEKPGKIGFIKIDIEGGEVELIPEMSVYLKSEKPILHLSLHGPYLDPVEKKQQLEKIVECLTGYSRCYNEHMENVPIDGSLINSSLERFASFTFMK